MRRTPFGMRLSQRSLKNLLGTVAFWIGTFNGFQAFYFGVLAGGMLLAAFVRHSAPFSTVPLQETEDAIVRSIVWFGLMWWAEREDEEPASADRTRTI